MSKPRNKRLKNTKSEASKTQSKTQGQGDLNMTDSNLTENGASSHQEAMVDEVSGEEPTVTINGNEYTVESLGQKGREQLHNLSVTDRELQRLQDRLAITQTARNTYARILADMAKNIVPVK
mgnify:CR=1 FL=1